MSLRMNKSDQRSVMINILSAPAYARDVNDILLASASPALKLTRPVEIRISVVQ